MTELEKGKFDILKTKLGGGTISGLAGIAFLKCTKVLGFITIECEYSGAGLKAEIGAAGGEGPKLHVTLTKSPVKIIAGGGLCPEESKVDVLLEVLEETLAHVLE